MSSRPNADDLAVAADLLDENGFEEVAEFLRAGCPVVAGDIVVLGNENNPIEFFAEEPSKKVISVMNIEGDLLTLVLDEGGPECRVTIEGVVVDEQ